MLYELLVAARTDEKLKATLQEELGQYAEKIIDAARTLPGAEQFPEDKFPVIRRISWRTCSTAPPWCKEWCRSRSSTNSGFRCCWRC